jgi:ABC-2 type transport system permease protein
MMVANSELQRVGLSGWRTGLANLLGKENRAWWASRRWLVQSLLWTVIVNGFTAVMLFVLPVMIEAVGGPEQDILGMGLAGLFRLGALALAAGAIVLVQDAILGERQLGVTEWLLSKPVSRPAYVLSKLLAHGLGVLVVLVGLQGVLGYGQLSLAMGEPFPLPAYLVGMVGLAVHTLFYLALTLMMGVLTANRPALLGTSMGVLLVGSLLVQALGVLIGKFVMLTPWALVECLPLAVQGMPLPLPIWLPIGVTAVLTVVFGAVTLARFERLEF